MDSNRILTYDKDLGVLLVGGPIMRPYKSKMADGRHLEKPKIAISLQFLHATRRDNCRLYNMFGKPAIIVACCMQRLHMKPWHYVNSYWGMVTRATFSSLADASLRRRHTTLMTARTLA